MMTFRPSTDPSSRRPCRNAAMRGAMRGASVPPSDRYPIRQTRSAGCAATPSGARRTATLPDTNRRRFVTG
jgi:hypothetical protein